VALVLGLDCSAGLAGTNYRPDETAQPLVRRAVRRGGAFEQGVELLPPRYEQRPVSGIRGQPGEQMRDNDVLPDRIPRRRSWLELREGGGNREFDDEEGAFAPELAAPTPRREAPFAPATGPRAPLAPNFSVEGDERISRRYTNADLVQLGHALSAEQALALYAETLTIIGARHLEPADAAAMCRAGLRSLAQALRNRVFLAAQQVNISSAQLQSFEQQLAARLQGHAVRSATDATAVLRLAMALAQGELGFRPGVVAVEFACAAVETLDEYSAFVPSPGNDAVSRQIDAEVVGIGVQIDAHGKGARIVRVFRGGPAERAGLQPGDVIVGIDGMSTSGAGIDQITSALRGQENTLITLEVAREGNSAARVRLPRSRLAVQSVSNAKIVDATAGVGYLKLDSFAERSAAEVERALTSLTRQGMRSLVLDLRGDPGGLLSTAVQIADLFLPEGVIVSTRGRTSQDNTSERARFERTWKVPLVILVDEQSASASEILAAAIQENSRGVIVGQRTFGKGTVQTLIPLQTAPAALRLTTARFYSPTGRAMANRGVTPDVAVEHANSQPGFAGRGDSALAAAIEVARKGTQQGMP
jgi:carboxyl-terminal processing protease